MDADKRPLFMKSVFKIVSVQLLVTLIIVGIVVAAAPTIVEVKEGEKAPVVKTSKLFDFFTNYITMGVATAVFFITTILLICYRHAHFNDTRAYVELALFTVATSIMVGSIAAKVNPWKVFMCVAFTAGDCFAIYAFILWQSGKKKSFMDQMVTCHEKFFVLSFITAIAIIFLVVNGKSWSLLWLSMFFVIFSFYLTIDIWLIVEDKYKSDIGIDSVVFAAVKLYIDVIGIFLLMLYACMDK